ncbi:hypothetical protein K402DRAFT_323272 [Aulographum hederae CBS 113979]|uniref:Life-span regulatory factor domain-containing protein n=1 Tax=Aulographum hederae CBS 113979 TaxID=1176131 RepID=A0A6G1HDA1_9PEZI|nr:hypothetical protein K402DRAFT_323272 [Aulographum hederae CBS 113979]
MDWVHHYCLWCDRQTAEGTYCSQACRLADLEKAIVSEPASPSSYASTPLGHSSSMSQSSSQGFHLPPAYNFSSRSKTGQNTPAAHRSSHSMDPTQQSYFSSASSTTSTHQASMSQAVTNQAIYQLRDYVNSFDQIRDVRRRSTLL